MLHQKELILNAADTENMLAAVDIVRQVVDSLKSSGLQSTLSSLGRVNNNATSEQVDQRVEITAEFPNAIDASEIKEAILGLADSSYQYAHKIR